MLPEIADVAPDSLPAKYEAGEKIFCEHCGGDKITMKIENHWDYTRYHLFGYGEPILVGRLYALICEICGHTHLVRHGRCW